MSNSRESRSTARSEEKEIQLRKGKWTLEEENYANKIITLFNQGKLPIVAGTTLRTYLSEKLHCDPMRITKKFAGASCIGKQVFQPLEEHEISDESFEENERELKRMEHLFLSRINPKGTYTQEISTHNSKHERLRPNKGIIESPEDEELKSALSEQEHNNPNDSFFPPDYTMKRTKLKGKNFKGSRRVMSTPNLSQLGHSRTDASEFQQSKENIREMFRRPINRSNDIPEEEEEEGEREGDDLFGHAKRLKSSTGKIGLRHEGGFYHRFRQRGEGSSVFPKKRSHSVMSLYELEKLVSDDRAAGDFFLQVVKQIGDKGDHINPGLTKNTHSFNTLRSSGRTTPILAKDQKFQTQPGEEYRVNVNNLDFHTSQITENQPITENKSPFIDGSVKTEPLSSNISTFLTNLDLDGDGNSQVSSPSSHIFTPSSNVAVLCSEANGSVIHVDQSKGDSYAQVPSNSSRPKNQFEDEYDQNEADNFF